MSEKCPFCGAAEIPMPEGRFYYACGTYGISEEGRSGQCWKAELAALQAQVEEMKPAGVKSNDIKTVLKWLDELALSQAPQEPVPELVDAVNRIEAALGKE